MGAAFATGFEDRTIKAVSGTSITLNSGATRPHPVVNNQWTAEVMNLTRNVRIEGTPTGKGHIFIRSTQPHTIKYIAIRNMGARKRQGRLQCYRTGGGPLWHALPPLYGWQPRFPRRRQRDQGYR